MPACHWATRRVGMSPWPVSAWPGIAPGVRALAVLSRGRALATAQRFAAGRIRGLDARLTIDLDERQQLGLSLWWWRDGAERLRAWQWMWSIRT